MKTAAIILGGGRGTRLGFPVPKQFARLKDRPLFDYSVEKFVALKVDTIVASWLTITRIITSPIRPLALSLRPDPAGSNRS